MGCLKGMMSEMEFRTWQCEFQLRDDDMQEAEMHARVDADAKAAARQ